MLGMARGCLRGLFGILLLVVLGALAFLQRDRLLQAWQELRGGDGAAAAVPSLALAEQAEQKLADLRDGTTETAAFDEVELQSLLQYRFRGLLPAFVDSPRVELEGSRIRITGRMPLDRLPAVGGFGEAAALLPDTTDLAVTGQLLPLVDGRVALAVDDVSVSRIPLPDRMLGPALERLGRRDEPGLPADAVALPLPPGAANAYVRGDSLVLVRTTAKRGS